MNFEQLQILTTLSKNKNYRQTAKQLSIPTKDVRKAIASLETELGYELFETLSDGTLSLTVYGEEVCDTSIRLLKLKQAMVNTLDDLKQSDGKLNINIGSTLQVRLTKLYNDYQLQHPGLHIGYIPNKECTIDMLLDGDIDILESENITLNDELLFEEIHTLPLQVYISSTHDLFINKGIVLNQLKDSKIYISNSNSQTLQKLIQELKAENMEYEILDADDVSIFKACEKNSVYIQEPVVTYPYTTIKVLPLLDDRFNFTYGLIYKKDAPNIVKNLINSISK